MLDPNLKIVCLQGGNTRSITVQELLEAVPPVAHAKLLEVLGNKDGEQYHLSHHKCVEVNRYANERFSGLMTAETYRKLVELEQRLAALEAPK